MEQSANQTRTKNIGEILLSVDVSKLIGIRCESLQKRFGRIVYMAAESSWENTD